MIHRISPHEAQFRGECEHALGDAAFDRLCAAGAKLRDADIGAIAFATADD